MQVNVRNSAAAGRERYRIATIDRIPKQRYFDADFYAAEAEGVWGRSWQMACRLEQIPAAGDWIEYRILDQSVVVVRTDDGGVTAFENACRHRGVRVAEGHGHCYGTFVCPFHGWRYGPDGTNVGVTQRRAFSEHNMEAAELNLTPVRSETWGGCAWINLSSGAPPLRDCIEPSATVLDGWQLGDMRAEWWRAFRLPVNWKLAEEAFVEQYHVITTHPRLVDPNRGVPRNAPFDPEIWRAAELHYLRTMSTGMAGMVHANDVRIAESLAGTELPADAMGAMSTWQRTLNDAVVAWHRARGSRLPDLNALEAAGMNEPMSYVFPHFFVLPMYSSASSYRFRPLGPEETLMEIWSLTRFPADEEPGPLPEPEIWECDDQRTPPIPSEDFSNLPRQQRGLHAKGFEYMRLSHKIEGHISNYHRLIDGLIDGASYESLSPALRAVNVNPLEQPIAEFGALS